MKNMNLRDVYATATPEIEPLSPYCSAPVDQWFALYKRVRTPEADAALPHDEQRMHRILKQAAAKRTAKALQTEREYDSAASYKNFLLERLKRL